MVNVISGKDSQIMILLLSLRCPFFFFQTYRGFRKKKPGSRHLMAFHFLFFFGFILLSSFLFHPLHFRFVEELRQKRVNYDFSRLLEDLLKTRKSHRNQCPSQERLKNRQVVKKRKKTDGFSPSYFD